MVTRVVIAWTNTARDCLKQLPKKVRNGIIAKADKLLETDPRLVHKPMLGVLAGLYSLKYSRYRALYSVTEELLEDGEVILHLHEQFLLAGIRKENDKQDIYAIAEKLMKLGALDGLNG